MLAVEDLNVSVEGRCIVEDVNLRVAPGEVHAVMGPNGSGKSTLINTLAGAKICQVDSGAVTFDGIDLLALSPEMRAREGLFIAFQYPPEIPGVSNRLFLRTAVNSVRAHRKQKLLDPADLDLLLGRKLELLGMSADLLDRPLNVGLSGGEKKCNDVLQMLILEPKLCLLDEIDSGLDVDVLKRVSGCINTLRDGGCSFVIVTHYQRILHHVNPDRVHAMRDGEIILSGDQSLVREIEERGYGWLG